MRNPERIPAILHTFQECWEKHPDWRLGQLLVNIAKPSEPCPQLFYLEDDVFLELLQEMSNSYDNWQACYLANFTVIVGEIRQVERERIAHDGVQ